MPSLKDIKDRKKSVISTKKITSAMKMISAAKLRKAQDAVVNSRAYALLMNNMLRGLEEKGRSFEVPPKLLVGTGRESRHMVVVITSDRGLSGSFNGNVVRKIIPFLTTLKEEDNPFDIVCIGRRGRDNLIASGFSENILESYSSQVSPKFYYVRKIANSILERFFRGDFDVCTVIYNRFMSVISQVVTTHRLVPYTSWQDSFLNGQAEELPKTSSIYEYEPTERQVLEQILPKNFAVQLYHAVLENAASEQGARMTAMDAATRNADDMIKKLDLHYNRTRQALVTRELIEIISGAEAL